MSETRKKRGGAPEAPQPTLEVHPSSVPEGQPIVLRGCDWGTCPVLLAVGGRRVRLARAALGALRAEGVQPDAHGEFVVEIATLDLEAGRHELKATSAHKTWKGRATAGFEIRERPRLDDAPSRETEGAEGDREEAGDSPYRRKRDFFKRRFGHLGFIPPGVRETQMRQIRLLRERRDRFKNPLPGPPSMPVPGACNWNPVGPGPVVVDATTSWAGRTLALAVDPTNPAIVYAGTAGGGVWKSVDGGTTWSPKSDYQRSLAIGTIAIDPLDTQRIFAGTGEYNDGGVGTYYGNGILFSANGGDTWSELGTTTFPRDEISRILFDPTDASSQRMFLSAATGVYASPDGGANWNQLRAGSASALVLLVTGANVQLIAGFYGSGIWTSTRTAGIWSAWTQFASPAFPAGFTARIALGQSRDHPQNLYAAFSDGNSIAGIARTTNGGGLWTRLTPPIAVDINKDSALAGAPAHFHTVTVPAADLDGVLAPHSYVTTVTSGHTHTVNVTVADLQILRNGSGSVTKLTQPDATGHQHSFVLDRRVSNQTWYNLHISPHPTDPNTVYYGDIGVWKTTTGDGPWTNLPILHTDQHAFAFDPVNPAHVWAGNDGGVYGSPDGGATWAHRNRDLQTLEYISVALHPQYESVMIGGTQDNGTQRYTGSPAWTLAAGGDGGFTAIDPVQPHRMYHQYVNNTFYRSDDSGAAGSWVLKNTGITGGAEFYAPFALDPSDPDNCYFGGAQLWRSPDNADSWAAITNPLAGNITTIAVHPADSNIIYAGTTAGHVYRVQRTGATWSLADVTTTDLTGPSLPAGVYLSDLAVDAAGNVWVTVSSLQWTEIEAFTNDHVYRRASGAGVWESRSGGLAQANPINCIVIDPMNADRLFCGGDLGVFRTEDAGVTWVPWDEGLPNVPVFDMALHNPRRLLRVATHGRSIWERPVDALSCPLVDLYMRDNILDTGRLIPSLQGLVHPFDATLNAWHWQSEDIKVDGPEPAFQTPSPIDNYVDFTVIEHRSVRRNRTNRFYVQVHNRGIGIATNVVVRGFFAAASPGLPPLPADFWSAGKPFSGTPGGTDWTAVGPARIFPVLEPGEPGIAEWDWFVPSSAPQHSCLLAVATCNEDPLSGAGVFDPDALVMNRKQVTLKNLHVEDAVPGMAMDGEQAFQLWLQPSRGDGAALRFELGSLPRHTRVVFAFEAQADGKPVLAATADQLKRLGITHAADAARLFPKKVESQCGNSHPLDLKNAYQLAVDGKSRRVVLPELRLVRPGPTLMAINVVLPGDLERGSFAFDVILARSQHVLGGNTFQLRVKAPARTATLRSDPSVPP
jgi:photosystem II stability/assembly factor-like uncharacterized protein